MPRATNAFQDEPSGSIQRGRGGFMRGANDTPWITDPGGAIVKSGPRKGELKRLMYGSPSGYEKQIQNTTNLQKWGERRGFLGLGIEASRGEFSTLTLCCQLAGLEVDSDDYKELADRIVVHCKKVAKTDLSANRGTHAHEITEDDDEGRNWIERAEAGELLDIPVDAQRAMVHAWRDMLVRDGLEILVSEASCVDDTWRLAGTLDNIARLSRPLSFRLVTGEIRTIPAGTVLILDKKTGQRRTDRKGVVQYWSGYAVQVASYAQSRPYDTVAETRGDWAWTIDQTHALIAHLDVLGAIEGNPSCQLVYVDLVAGREHGGATVVSAKEWAKRDDVFSVGQLVDEDHATSTAPAVVDAAPSAPVPPTVEQDAAGVEGPPVLAPADPFDGLAPHHGPGFENGRTPAPEPRIPLHAKQLAVVAKRPIPNEGDICDEQTAAALEAHYKTLSNRQRKWMATISMQATQHGVSFHLSQSKTVRRFEIIRGLICLVVAHTDDEGEVKFDEEFIRALLAFPLGDLAHFPAVDLGHLIGTLGATEATAFADAVDRFVTGGFTVGIDEAIDKVELTPTDLRPALAQSA